MSLDLNRLQQQMARYAPAARPKDYRSWRLKFYADNEAENVKNKLFSFYVEDGALAARLLDRFLFNGWRFRAVWMVYSFDDKQSARVPSGLLDELARYGFENAFTRSMWYETFPKFL